MSAGRALDPVAPLQIVPDEPGERGLPELARALWARRAFTLGLAIGAALLAAALAFVMPPTYEAVTTVIPVPTSPRSMALEQLGQSASDLGLPAGATPNRAAMYPEVVRSRRLLEILLATPFPGGRHGESRPLIDFVQKPGATLPRLELAVKKLRGRVDALLDRRTGVLTIRVRAGSPALAAGIANALFAQLQQFTVHAMASQASENRKFIESRLDGARRTLARAEDELRTFREENLRIGNAPRLLLEQARLARELRAQEEIFLTLTRQYELAKIEEQRDVPVLNVLDPAAVPAFRVAPRRARMIAFGFLLGAGLAAALVLMRKPTPPKETR